VCSNYDCLNFFWGINAFCEEVLVLIAIIFTTAKKFRNKKTEFERIQIKNALKRILN
jgi:hypothetical protein